MTNPIDILRPEVRKLIEAMKAECQPFGWATIIAELLRLAEENAQLRDVLADRDMDREMAAHANKELAALKARIAQSCRAYHSSFENTLDASTLYARATGVPGEQVFALVLVEE